MCGALSVLRGVGANRASGEDPAGQVRTTPARSAVPRRGGRAAGGVQLVQSADLPHGRLQQRPARQRNLRPARWRHRLRQRANVHPRHLHPFRARQRRPRPLRASRRGAAGATAPILAHVPLWCTWHRLAVPRQQRRHTCPGRRHGPALLQRRTSNRRHHQARRHSPAAPWLRHPFAGSRSGPQQREPAAGPCAHQHKTKTTATYLRLAQPGKGSPTNALALLANLSTLHNAAPKPQATAL